MTVNHGGMVAKYGALDANARENIRSPSGSLWAVFHRVRTDGMAEVTSG